ncbi:OLC1v1035327C1 [Oldenlandia corymbosa var. corymbosa]|uniref:OLC1v1035327C1 n=1 Tax=Oldenlandia corymbosa var. corymbosa TaxID=529605 RepID=A0AAV1CTL0_OLDCO|nr:OLC1v1035327C1 [Oldenlandia corymbosa var. corymbosa]
MRSPGSVKREFLRKWLKGLQVYSSSNNEMSILERKKVIKLSADVAMASTRIHSNSKYSSSWSRALMAKASNDASNAPLLSHVLGSDNGVSADRSMISEKDAAKRNLVMMRNKRIKSKKILRRSCSNKIRSLRRKAAHVVDDKGRTSSNIVAKKLVMKRTQVLKRLVPGGELIMDEISLIRETLDYILSLRLQVDVMRHLANASEKLDSM